MKQRFIQLLICFIYFVFGGLLMTLWQHHSDKNQQLERSVFTNKVAFIRGRFSADDIFQIRKLIATKTNKDILSITNEDGKEIEVMTGSQRGPLDGGGIFFTIKKENDQWIITSQGSWAS